MFSGGMYQVCALRAVPDSMSQVGSGRRRLELRAVGLMSVMCERTCRCLCMAIAFLETGLSEENVCEWRKLFIRLSTLSR